MTMLTLTDPEVYWHRSFNCVKTKINGEATFRMEWNSLPDCIRTAETVDAVRRDYETCNDRDADLAPLQESLPQIHQLNQKGKKQRVAVSIGDLQNKHCCHNQSAC